MITLLTRLSCALVATVTLVTATVGSASAAPQGQTTADTFASSLTQVDDQVVSTLTDKASGAPAGYDPGTFGVHPAEDPRSAGAMMNQTAKSAEHFGAPAPSSLQEFVDQAHMAGAAAYSPWRPNGIQGLDVSSHQPQMNWTLEWNRGARFAYVKATEGNFYKSPAFADQYTGSYQTGMIRGAYHFAIPAASSGAAQADYFVNSGGGWSADGKTLPGLLDIEYNPYPTYYGNSCYNMSPIQLNTWIKDFSTQYKARTGRLPMIYTTADWWRTCTGNTPAFNDHPLHLASYGVSSPLWYPNGWSTYDLWQYSDSGPFVGTAGGDSNVFGGTQAQLDDLARNPLYKPLGGRAPAGAAAPQPVIAPTPFRDVAASHVFAKEITWMSTSGISGGWAAAGGTKEYRPSVAVSRDVMAAFLYRMAGSPAFTAPKTSPFTDVTPQATFYKEISWMAASGISTGWAAPGGKKEYRPHVAVSRDVMAAFLYRMAGSPAFTAPTTSSFADVIPQTTFYKEMSWMAASEISGGWAVGGTKEYRPHIPVTRDVMAAFLYRLNDVI
ncbi:GH25 family lysozyme [Arthrobacter sp. TMS2-4]